MKLEGSLEMKVHNIMSLFSQNIHLIVIHNDSKTIIIEPHEIHLAKLLPLTFTCTLRLCFTSKTSQNVFGLTELELKKIIRTGPLFSNIAYNSVAYQ